MEAKTIDIVDIKSRLHEAVENIDDADFLRALALTVAMRYTPTSGRVLISKEQREALNRAKTQIESGNAVSEERSNERVDRWLSE